MKVLVIGASGKLGTDLRVALQDFDVIPLTHHDLEITDMNSVRKLCSVYRPDAIINTAVYQDVDECETNANKAFMVNALGPKNLAVIAQEMAAKLVHFSTNYVFGGEARLQAFPYTEFETPVPLNVFGRSKLAGEEFVQHLCSKYFIIRTSGLFGIAGNSSKGGNFVETMLKLAEERDKISVVNDQVFSPTYTKDLAQKIAQLIDTQYYGIFHITNSSMCSWFEFAEEILRLAGSQTPVIPVTSDQYPQKARRPRFSVLDNYHLRLLGMDDMRPWPNALKDYMKEKGYLNQM
jgi:dTDP-4-dehydrorhamnose reductase